MGKIVLGVILGMALAPAVLLAWLRWGQPPVTVADPPLPFETWITQVPLNARIDREMIKTSPIQADEDNLVAGAQIYRDECAGCHGFHGKPSSLAAHMYPKAPSLWEKHKNKDAVGVSDDPPGETFWKASNGIRLTGMPAFKDILNEAQMWQVSLLIANADKPLPPAALAIVRGEQAPAAPQNAPTPRH
jgi:mono/diheme cytochrome c family protein